MAMKKKAPAKKAIPKKGDEAVRMGRSAKQSADSAGKFKPTDTAGRTAPTDMSKRYGENSDSGFFFNAARKKQAYGQGRTDKRLMDQRKRASVKKTANAAANAKKVAKGKK
jgi:hypothetical protein